MNKMIIFLFFLALNSDLLCTVYFRAIRNLAGEQRGIDHCAFTSPLSPSSSSPYSHTQKIWFSPIVQEHMGNLYLSHQK